MILGLMSATAFLSAWVSNTATVAMMVPIAISVLGVIRSAQTSEAPSIEEKNFGIAVLLAIAFSASIGGMATLIGSPPNGIFVRFMEQTYGQTITFTEWMTVALPIVACLMPACYLLLTKVVFPCKIDGIPGGREWVRDELLKLGDMTRGEKVVLAVFATAALMWIFGPWIRGFEIDGARPFAPFRDEIIAMCAGMALFVLPVDIDRHIHALDWQSAKDVVAWDVLLLFGGGLTMAAAIQSTGAASLIGAQAASFAGLGEIPMIARLLSERTPSGSRAGRRLVRKDVRRRETLGAETSPLPDSRKARSLPIGPLDLSKARNFSAIRSGNRVRRRRYG